MMKKIIKIEESDLHRVIKKTIENVLSESYRHDLYHFTNLEGLYGILESNCLSAVVTGDDEYDDNDEAVCLSRTGSPYIGYSPDTEYDLIFRITLDTEKMLSSIRGMKVKPWSMNNPRTVIGSDNRYRSVSDYEERAYKSVSPLNKFCKSIDVFPYTKGDSFDDEQIEILNQLIDDFPQWNSFFSFSDNNPET